MCFGVVDEHCKIELLDLFIAASSRYILSSATSIKSNCSLRSERSTSSFAGSVSGIVLHETTPTYPIQYNTIYNYVFFTK